MRKSIARESFAASPRRESRLARAQNSSAARVIEGCLLPAVRGCLVAGGFVLGCNPAPSLPSSDPLNTGGLAGFSGQSGSASGVGASGAVSGTGASSFGGSGHAGFGNAGAGNGGASARQLPDWDAELRLGRAEDTNSDPHVFETTLDAQLTELEVLAGVRSQLWTYSGALPGPMIHVREGDRAIVHFKNSLAKSTTIHWHGLRVPNAVDGAPGHTQPAIEPGQSFTYDFVVPDAGLYWYHPHVDSAEQVGNGLYAPFLVDEPESLGLGDELTLVLSDVSLDAEGQLSPSDSGGDLGTLFGREGTVLLVNGKVRPTLKARSGLLQRWRIVNTSRSRYFQLALEGHSFRRIGGDAGLMAAPVDSDRLVVVPAERADVLIVPVGEPGTRVPVRWVPYDRGFGTVFNRPEEELFVVQFAGDPVTPPEPLPSPRREILPLDLTGATEVKLELTQQSAGGEPIELGINGVPASKAEALQASLGETQIWTVTNPTIAFAHPFHLHGYFFQVLDEANQPKQPLEWKDTADVPVQGTLRFAVRFDDRPGTWMYHCHILDHADAGMMGMLHVGEHPTH